MSKITGNIEELRKILKEENFKLDEAIEFLYAIKSDADSLESEIRDLEEVLKARENEVAGLEEDLDSFRDKTLNNRIYCGIGEIEYSEPDNLLLQNVMENLESAIKKNTPRKVNEVLETLI